MPYRDDVAAGEELRRRLAHVNAEIAQRRAEIVPLVDERTDLVRAMYATSGPPKAPEPPTPEPPTLTREPTPWWPEDQPPFWGVARAADGQRTDLPYGERVLVITTFVIMLVVVMVCLVNRSNDSVYEAAVRGFR